MLNADSIKVIFDKSESKQLLLLHILLPLLIHLFLSSEKSKKNMIQAYQPLLTQM